MNLKNYLSFLFMAFINESNFNNFIFLSNWFLTIPFFRREKREAKSLWGFVHCVTIKLVRTVWTVGKNVLPFLNSLLRYNLRFCIKLPFSFRKLFWDVSSHPTHLLTSLTLILIITLLNLPLTPNFKFF